MAASGAAGTAGAANPTRRREKLARQVSARLTSTMLLGVALTTSLTPLLTRGDVPSRILEAGLIVVAAFLPGWLFVRFLTHRVEVLWHEYVLNLHRLRMDHPSALPVPPKDSIYYPRWAAYQAREAQEGRLPARPAWTLYQAKFEAYYGKGVTRWLRERDPESVEDPGPGGGIKGLVSVALAVAVFAAGWASVVSTRSYAEPLSGSTADALRLAFLGAYVFSLQMIMRRYFQGDLKASAYISSVVRVLTVLAVAAVVNVAPGIGGRDPGTKAMVAFVVGLFPIAALQMLQKGAWRIFRWVDDTFRTNYPLSHIDGLNVWYEARLLEEGIEDLENLATANLVEVLLHTRVPVGRLVDWIDQAILYLHLPLPKGPAKDRNPQRARLRQLGVRNATELLEAFDQAPGASNAQACDRALNWALDLPEVVTGDGSTPVRPVILRAIKTEPNLVHVRHWKSNWAEEEEGTNGQEAAAAAALGNGGLVGVLIEGPTPSGQGTQT